MWKRGIQVALGGVVLLAMTGCIAVSKEVRHQPVTSKASTAVPPGGQWEIDQEWRCADAESFDLATQSRGLDDSIAEWANDGWDLDHLDVVSSPEEVCLVTTYRRWRSD